MEMSYRLDLVRIQPMIMRSDPLDWGGCQSLARHGILRWSNGGRLATSGAAVDTHLDERNLRV